MEQPFSFKRESNGMSLSVFEFEQYKVNMKSTIKELLDRLDQLSDDYNKLKKEINSSKEEKVVKAPPTLNKAEVAKLAKAEKVKTEGKK